MFNSASKNADYLTSQLNDKLIISAKIVQYDLPQLLIKAITLLEKAKIEFNDNAFGPFWDAIEEVALILMSFNNSVRELSKNAEYYYSSLNNLEHNFPIFYPANEKLPDPKLILDEFQPVVRKGQTNFQFATIWEQRKTRQVLIEGFKTLGEAIYKLSSTVEKSIYDLCNSISSGVARLVKEEINSRESFEKHARCQKYIAKEIDKKLDNIQHDLKQSY